VAKYITTGDLCEVVTDAFVKEGVKRGHLVYVAGHKALPISEEDPYTQRIKFFIHTYNAIEKVMGKELYLMDANSLVPLDKRETDRLLAEYKEFHNL
jgi:hypothetical protein